MDRQIPAQALRGSATRVQTPPRPHDRAPPDPSARQVREVPGAQSRQAASCKSSRRAAVAGVGASLLTLAGQRLYPQNALGAETSTGSAAQPNASAAGTLRSGDLTVNRIGYGAMRITGDGIWGAPADVPEARAVLRRAIELGVNLIDTADAYGPDVSEQLIYESLHPYPAGLVIATKGGFTRPGPDQWVADGRPEHLRAACEGSLRRLHLERIDLYQLHTPDPNVPFEDSIGELVRLREQGKIRYIGVSNVTLAQLKRAQALAPIVSVQNRYNVGDRGNEAVLQYCASQRLAYLPWAPLGGRRSRRRRILEALWSSSAERVAQAHSVSTARVVLAWLLQHSSALLPIPGTSSRAHLEDNVAAGTLRLTPAELA